MKFKTACIALLGILLIMPACNRRDDTGVSAAPEDRNTTATDTVKQQRDAYVDSIQAKLNEYDQKFDGLDARAVTMKGTAKDSFNKSVDRLRDQRQQVEKKLDDLKDVSAESWMTMKTEVDTAMADLERSYEQVAAAHETVPAAKPNQSSSPSRY